MFGGLLLQAVQLAAQARSAKAALTDKPAAAQVPSARKSEDPQRKPVIKPRIQIKRQQVCWQIGQMKIWLRKAERWHVAHLNSMAVMHSLAALQLPEEAEAKKARVEPAAAAPQKGAALTGLAGYGSGSDSD